MVEPQTERLLAAEALEEDDVALVLRVWDLEDHGLAGRRILGLEDRGHPAACEELGELVVINLLSGGDLAHQAATASVSTGATIVRAAPSNNRRRGSPLNPTGQSAGAAWPRHPARVERRASGPPCVGR